MASCNAPYCTDKPIAFLKNSSPGETTVVKACKGHFSKYHSDGWVFMDVAGTPLCSHVPCGKMATWALIGHNSHKLYPRCDQHKYGVNASETHKLMTPPTPSGPEPIQFTPVRPRRPLP